jgi:ABC-type phosphate/phosphonate transport system substrate-binding protein
MKRLIRVGAAATAALLSLLAAFRSEAAGRDMAPSTIRVGLVDTLYHGTPDAVMAIGMRPLKLILEEQTGKAGEILSGGSFEDLAQQLKDDKVQLAVFHGVEFAWARQKQPSLKALLVAVNQRRDARADLVVRKDAKYAGPEDLKGQAVALPRFSHEHCWLFLRRRCAPPETAPEKYFSQMTAPVTDEDALDDVVDGAVQAAVVDTVFLEAYQKDKPGRAARLHTLVHSEAYPGAILVIAYHPGVLNDKQLERFRDAMTDAQSTENGRRFLKLCRVTAFEAAPDDFEQTLADAAKKYPPLEK